MKYQFGEFELNPATRELLRKGCPVALRPRSLECLVYLIEHRDRAVGRDELISAVWGRVDAGDTVVAQTLLRARKALDDTGNQQGMIRTLPRFGYRWVAPVREVPTSFNADAEQVRAGANQAIADDVPKHDRDLSAGIEADPDPYAADGELEGDAGHDPFAAAADIGHSAAADPTETPPPSARVDEPPRSKQPKRRLPIVALFAFVVALVAAGVAFYWRQQARPPAMPANDAVLVMPVAVVPLDSENAWVRLGAMDYVATRLRGSGINVLPSEQALRLDAALKGDTPAEAKTKLLALSGARWIALPEMRRQGDAWSIRLQILDGQSERMLESRGATALGAAAEAADAWLRQLGEQGRAGPPPGPLTERLHRIDAEILAGRLTEARRLVRSSAPAERDDPRFQLREGKLEFRATNFDAAARHFQASLDRVPQTDPETRVGALLGLGNVERARNNLDEAELRYTQVLNLLEALPADRINARLQGIAYQGRGITFAQRGNIEAGINDMGQARVWLQRSGDLITLGSIGHNLGKAEALRGDYLQALREFDRSIATFERFRVSDYLANSLHEKAEVQLSLARPADAFATIGRTDALLPALEDDALAGEILLTKARTRIALGQLRQASASLAGARSRGVPDADPHVIELRLRLHLARGEIDQARVLAGQPSGAEAANEGLLLAAVQAAVRARDIPLAKAWLAAAGTPAPQVQGSTGYALSLAHAFVGRADGQAVAALADADKAIRSMGVQDSPDREIQAGVMRALLQLDTHQYAAASAIMGELEKYSETDYRVAWVMFRLYQALDDPQATAAALSRAKALGGERDIRIEPVL